MEARIARAALFLAAILSTGAGYRTQNFIVTCQDPQFEQQVALEAERYRRDLAIEWLGEELPPWEQPCPIQVNFAKYASGRTSFGFAPIDARRGYPVGWDMMVEGPRDRILDAVLPHEITHTIFATHFGQRLPRWADEGACTTVEHESEREKHRVMLVDFLIERRGIPFNRMFRMMEYPHDMLPLYAQGHSVADFLIRQQGRRHFVGFVGSGLDTGNWDRATSEFYGYRDLSDLQLTWNEWVRQGSGPVTDQYLAAARTADTNPSATLRGGDAPHQPPSRDGRSLAQVDSSSGGQPTGADARVAAESWYFATMREHQSATPEITAPEIIAPESIGPETTFRSQAIDGSRRGGSTNRTVWR